MSHSLSLSDVQKDITRLGALTQSLRASQVIGNAMSLLHNQRVGLGFGRRGCPQFFFSGYVDSL